MPTCTDTWFSTTTVLRTCGSSPTISEPTRSHRHDGTDGTRHQPPEHAARLFTIDSAPAIEYTLRWNDSVAQLDRASASGAEGWWFEPTRSRQKTRPHWAGSCYVYTVTLCDLPGVFIMSRSKSPQLRREPIRGLVQSLPSLQCTH